ncbi:MAG: GDP-mannose 4,6-dehydratase [Candidatus Shapirobacteria bacterium]|jgi:GDPmannose 4,6-dehydratase
MFKKKALITGISGQDGSYLAEFLLVKGYEVYGLVKELPNKENKKIFFRIENVLPQITLFEGDITDFKKIQKIISELVPDEVYDLAAILDPLVSSDTERKILLNNLTGVHAILSSIKEHSPKTKLFFAASSLIFGNPTSFPQNEETPKEPITPYGIAKVVGCNLVKMYREVYGVFACYGILYNHESPRRDSKFLPKKISEAAVKIKLGLQSELKLGDLDAVRDWGYAKDYVEAMWLMLQQDKPDDYVIGTGSSHTVRDILEVAFGELNLDWKKYVVIDNKFIRKRENIPLLANPQKVEKQLGWRAHTKFDDLIKILIKHDITGFTNGKQYE